MTHLTSKLQLKVTNIVATKHFIFLLDLHDAPFLSFILRCLPSRQQRTGSRLLLLNGQLQFLSVSSAPGSWRIWSWSAPTAPRHGTLVHYPLRTIVGIYSSQINYEHVHWLSWTQPCLTPLLHLLCWFVGEEVCFRFIFEKSGCNNNRCDGGLYKISILKKRNIQSKM